MTQSNQGMADQLWYTHSPTLLGGGAGFGVRAASTGLKDLRSNRCTRVIQMLGYSLPDGTSSWSIAAPDAPISLLYTPIESEWLLANKVYAGLDSTGQRHGNFFVHVLAGLANWSIRKAIGLWRSPFWCRTADSLPADIFDLDPVDVAAIQPGQAPRDSIDWPNIARWLPIAIRLFMALEPKQRLYIVGSADRVAGLIWGLTQALPESLTAAVSFSTFERDSQRTPAAIVGWHAVYQHDGAWEPDPDKDLPEPCYTSHLALNTLTSRHSSLPLNALATRFSEFAVDCLENRPNDLADLVKTAEQLRVRDKHDYLRLCDQHLSGYPTTTWTPDSLIGPLSEVSLDASFWRRKPMQASILAWIANAPRDWQQRGRRAVAVLRDAAAATEREDSEQRLACAELCEAGYQRIRLAIQEGNHRQAMDIFDQLVLPASIEEPPGPAFQLLAELKELTSASHPPEFRSWLLEKAEAAIPVDQGGADVRVSPWLSVPWADLDYMLSRTLVRHSWLVHMLGTLIASLDPQQPIPEPVIQSLPRHLSLFQECLADMLGKDQFQERLVGFLAALSTPATSPVSEAKLALIKHLIDRVTTKPALYPALDGILEAAGLDLTREKALLEEALPLLLPSLRTQPGVGYILRRYMRAFQVEDCTRPAAYELLDKLEGQAADLPDEVLIAIVAWYPIAEALRWQRFDSPQLLRRGLKVVPGDTNYKIVAELIRTLAGTIAAQYDVEIWVDRLGTILTGSKLELYGRLLDFLPQVETESLADALIPFVEACFARSASSRDAPLSNDAFRAELRQMLAKLDRDTLKVLKKQMGNRISHNSRFDQQGWQQFTKDLDGQDRGHPKGMLWGRKS